MGSEMIPAFFGIHLRFSASSNDARANSRAVLAVFGLRLLSELGIDLTLPERRRSAVRQPETAPFRGRLRLTRSAIWLRAAMTIIILLQGGGISER